MMPTAAITTTEQATPNLNKVHFNAVLLSTFDNTSMTCIAVNARVTFIKTTKREPKFDSKKGQ